MISTVKGRFNTFTGTGETSPDGVIKSAELSIDAASINTNVDARDNHLRSADFLNTDAFPEIRYESDRFEQVGDSLLRVTGHVTLQGQPQPITTEVTVLGQGRTEFLETASKYGANCSLSDIDDRLGRST